MILLRDQLSVSKSVKSMLVILLLLAGLSNNIQAGLILRFADIDVDGGHYGGGVTDDEANVFSAPSAELNNVSSYELAFVAPIKAPYHFYLRYKSLSANDYVTNLAGPQRSATEFEKRTYDIGLFIPHYLFSTYNETVFALRYDDIEHKIFAQGLPKIGINEAIHSQGLWGVHIADKVYFPLHEKWKISTGAALNMVYGERQSDYRGTLNTSVTDTETSSWFGLDGEVALIFQATESFSITGGYTYSIMFDYLLQDVYAAESLENAGMAADNRGEADYIEQGPFIELMLNF
ncbi:MAG: hypothetical protein HRU20_22090 [Pseudomonadales bacterium]|nr:hypothetical protein [Pseudomonadales bacterium]